MKFKGSWQKKLKQILITGFPFVLAGGIMFNTFSNLKGSSSSANLLEAAIQSGAAILTGAGINPLGLSPLSGGGIAAVDPVSNGALAPQEEAYVDSASNPDYSVNYEAPAVTENPQEEVLPLPFAYEAQKIYRLWNTNTGTFFYTSSYDEVEIMLEVNGWQLDGDLGTSAPSTNGTPVYRAINRTTGATILTTDYSEYMVITKATGWEGNGIAMYTGGTTPVYCLSYELNGVVSYYYSSDSDIIGQMVNLGWKVEKEAFKL